MYKNSNSVKELNKSNFIKKNNNYIPASGNPTLIKFYAHWCPHCSNPKMHEFVETLGKNLPKKASIDVAAFNCEADENSQELSQEMGIMGYPTFRYYNKNGKMSEYQGGMDIESMLRFLLKNS
jgi:thiol-disulfide isomerase/thioredoxin